MVITTGSANQRPISHVLGYVLTINIIFQRLENSYNPLL